MVPGYYPCVMAGQEGSPAPGEPGRPKRRRRRRRKQASSGEGATAAAKGSSKTSSTTKGSSKEGSSKGSSQKRSGARGTRTRKDPRRKEPKAKGTAKGAARAPRIPTQREVSAGGVLYRRADGDIEVVLASRRTRRGDLAWGLAKGGIERGETREQAALREVREETGLDATIEADLGDTRYIYVWEDVRIRKRVHFFLMRHTGGNVEDRDDEMEEVRWFPLERALKRAAYRGERDVLARAAELLR
jgi:8-oxo-dGTP pyrophosphatase MutT (NUDIX family)